MPCEHDDRGRPPGDRPRVTIRRPDPADGDQIGRVHVRAWRSGYAGLMPRYFLDGLDEEERGRAWTQRLERQRAGIITPEEFLVAEIEEPPSPGGSEPGASQIVGIATLGPERVDPTTGRGEVWMLNVLPEAWRTGVGRALLRAATERLVELGYRGELVLWVLEGNHRARAFYEQLGWAPDGATKLDAFGGSRVRELRYRLVP